jgi:hypothetical protein
MLYVQDRMSTTTSLPPPVPGSTKDRLDKLCQPLMVQLQLDDQYPILGRLVPHPPAQPRFLPYSSDEYELALHIALERRFRLDLVSRGVCVGSVVASRRLPRDGGRGADGQREDLERVDKAVRGDCGDCLE